MSSGNLLQSTENSCYNNNNHHPHHMTSSSSQASPQLARGGSHNNLDKPSPPLSTFIGYSPKRRNQMLHSPQMPIRGHHRVRMSIDDGATSGGVGSANLPCSSSGVALASSLPPSQSPISGLFANDPVRPISPLAISSVSGSNAASASAAAAANHEYAVPNMFQSNNSTGNSLNLMSSSAVGKQPINGTTAAVGGHANYHTSSSSNHAATRSLPSTNLSSANQTHSAGGGVNPRGQQPLSINTAGSTSGGSSSGGPASGGAGGGIPSNQPNSGPHHYHHSTAAAVGNSSGGTGGGTTNSSGATSRSSFKKDDKISSKLRKAIQERVTGKSSSDYMQDVG